MPGRSPPTCSIAWSRAAPSRPTTSASSTGAPIFPTSSFAYAHDLEPELAAKIKQCFYDYRFPPEMTKAFDGDDRFFPITYQKDWAIVRKVAEDSGTAFDKAAYEKETAREAEAARKKAEGQTEAMTAAPAVVAATSEGDARALLHPQAAQGVPAGHAGAEGHRPRDTRARHHRGHRPVRHRQVHADPLHQPPGRADRGRDPVRGQDLAKLSGLALRQARRRIGMVFQEYNLVERLTVMENLLCGRLGYVAAWRAWLRTLPAGDIERAFELLDAVGLAGFATRRADALSGGQRQRVGIARGVMQQPDLLLADEPTSSLDPKTSVEIMELLAQLAGERDIPVIVNMHNVELARRFAAPHRRHDRGRGRLSTARRAG